MKKRIKNQANIFCRRRIRIQYRVKERRERIAGVKKVIIVKVNQMIQEEDIEERVAEGAKEIRGRAKEGVKGRVKRRGEEVMMIIVAVDLLKESDY